MNDKTKNITTGSIRAAGGIVNSNGSIFFANSSELHTLFDNLLAAAKLGMPECETSLRALTDAEQTALHDKLGGKPKQPTFNETKIARQGGAG